MKFKVLIGKHSEKDAKGIPHTYKPGDTFDSKSDLRKFNAPGMSPKFELLDDPKLGTKTLQAEGQQVPVSATSVAPAIPATAPKDLREYHAAVDKMNLKQLQDHAAEEEIALKDDEKNDVNKIRKILKAV